MKSTKLSFVYWAAAFLVVLTFVATLYFGWPFFSILGNPDRAREMIESYGAWSPVIFILAQVAQVFFAPIPGQITGVAGGYLFGTFWGTVYTMIGSAIGFTGVFLLSRKLGRPFVEHFVSPSVLTRFDYLAEKNGILALFVIFLLPTFPDDMICFIAGLSRLKIRTLILISLIGRLPGVIALSMLGSGVAESDIRLIAGVLIFILLLTVITYVERARLERFIKRF